ncbi:hypothetical protein IDH26_04560 [Pelagibacterales bacterium SAG-MED50]|nr:hypothetical protein [Pelagibacterales bacterium SAG-MED50]
MKTTKQTNDYEINLIDWLMLVWKGKWKITLAILISIMISIIYHISNKSQTNSFISKTKILPITIDEESNYIPLQNIEVGKNMFEHDMEIANSPNENNYEILTVDNSMKSKLFVGSSIKYQLLSLFIEILNERKVFQKGIQKYNIIDANSFSDINKYNEEVVRLASSIKIISPMNIDKRKKGGVEISYAIIEFKHHDVENWKAVLKYAEKLANENVKKNLLNKIDIMMSIEEQKRVHLLEDVTILINNIVDDYDRETKNRVKYLREQSEIAKKLGIAQNTIEVQTFGNQNALLSNVKTDSPFYLRGYEAIDKEIELIDMRTDKRAFVDGLLELEQKKRKLQQDKTIQRTKLVLNSTPLGENNDFLAASINTSSTTFEFVDNSPNKSIFSAMIFGLIIGIFYVSINNAIKSKKNFRKN